MSTTRRKAGKSTTPRTPGDKAAAIVQLHRLARCERMLAKIRAAITPAELADATGEPAWWPLAATFALRLDSASGDFTRVGKALAEAIAKDVVVDYTVRISWVRVLNLLYNLAWVADPRHEPDTWPLRHWEEQ
jgi:hypothetical protein